MPLGFTPQQLSGGQRYGPQTRVGNWAEDVCLEESKLAEFGEKQEKGGLVMSEVYSKQAKYNRGATLSGGGDGLTRFGDTVMVTHATTGTSLAVDLTESVYESAKELKLATASAKAEPVARNTFVVVKADASTSGEVLRYGEPFYLRTDSSLSDEPYYLASGLKTERNASRISNQQPVFLIANATPAAVWTCEKITTNTGVERLLSGDEAAPAHVPLVLQHRATKQALAADPKFADLTDFGRELEATCHNHYGKAKVAALAAEASGKSTPATNARLENAPNFWIIKTA